MKKQKLIYSSSIAAILSALFVTVITILAEKAPVLKTWLADFSGHHWTSKSILSLAIYFSGLIIFYLIPRQVTGEIVKKYLKVTILAAFLGALAIFIFFSYILIAHLLTPI